MSHPHPAVAACAERGGAARAHELAADGLSRRCLQAAVRDGLLIRPRQGVYVVPEAAASVVDAMAHRGVIACVTAARAFGLWTLDDGADEPTHVWVDPDRHAAEPRDRCPDRHHRDRAPAPPRVWTVGLVHCLAQIARCKGAEAFIAALESALRRGLLTAGDRAVLRAAVPTSFARLVDFARSDADSGLESLVRYRLHLLGIPVATQVAIPGVGIVDFVIGDCLILEADGRTHDGDSRHTDRVRDAAALALGFIPLRFDSQLILHDWALVEAAILSALGRGLHRSPAGLRRDRSRPLEY